MSAWYKKQYRRLLVDMHINDTKSKFLSKFSAESYFNYLKEAKIQSPMIYLQSHTGLCNFPTKVAKIHNFFAQNPTEINKLINLCKNDGMKVVGYYSLIFNNFAADTHPDWEIVDSNGNNYRHNHHRYGLCCPNNNEYRNFVVEQIKELSENFKNLDGIFFDMPYWETTCYCSCCKQKWEKISSNPMPTSNDFDNEDVQKFNKAKQDWMVDFVKFVRETANKYMPNVTVEFNYAAGIACDYVAGSTEGINDESEFTGGDLYGDLYNHSLTAKYYYQISKAQPFEYMTCRCNKTLREHTISKNEITLESEVMLTSMHHGASLLIDAINPDGTLDNRVAKRIGKVFNYEMPYEPYMDKGELYSEIAIYYDSKNQYLYHGRNYNKICDIALSKTLIENHIPFSLIANNHAQNLEKYQMIIAPSKIGDTEIDNFINYVKNGGTLYISGDSNAKLLKELFNGEIVSETNNVNKYPVYYRGYDEAKCYISPKTSDYKKIFKEFNAKYPLPIKYNIPILKYENGDTKATITLADYDPDNNYIYASIHSNPPGRKTSLPAIVETTYGKGKVIYSAALIESDERYNFKDIIISIINKEINHKFYIDSSKYVESIIFKDGDTYFLNLFDLNFANEVVDRKFEITLPNNEFEVKELITNKEYKINKNKVKGHFKKYLSLIIKSK